MKLILSTELIASSFFGHGTCCMLILLMKLVPCWFLSSWNLCMDFSGHEPDYAHDTFCVLSFVRETRCMLIFLFVKVLHWFFLLVKLICCLWYSLNADFFFVRGTDFVHGTCSFLIYWSWNLLLANFCSWNLLHVDFFSS